ncbi:hypothetical protein Taro_035082 [Colocasia esculenta]|uniref:CCHC-type domain-containing protein n=1 Tax=Colocasia esculenta TaxID=4460 RepID=A0A843VTB0_COLES|nr:hypothetical protein [Colocasia esculenta]
MGEGRIYRLEHFSSDFFKGPSWPITAHHDPSRHLGSGHQVTCPRVQPKASENALATRHLRASRVVSEHPANLFEQGTTNLQVPRVAFEHWAPNLLPDNRTGLYSEPFDKGSRETLRLLQAVIATPQHTPPSVHRFCHGSVDTPIDGVDIGVKCVDTAPGSVDTCPRFQKTCLPDWDSVSTQSRCVSTLVTLPREQILPERGLCIQRSRAAPPREEEGEEEKEIVIAAVLIQKEIQPKLGSIVIQRFEYFVLYFGAPVLWVGAVVLWCLSRGAQGLVNLLNSQVVFRVGRCAYLLGFFELLNSKRLESSCSSLYCTCASGSSVVTRCNKSGHMKADCPEGKKEKHINHKKEFHKKKNKAMEATWSDDESSDYNEESSTSDENEVCFMAGNSEEHVSPRGVITLHPIGVECTQLVLILFHFYPPKKR